MPARRSGYFAALCALLLVLASCTGGGVVETPEPSRSLAPSPPPSASQSTAPSASAEAGMAVVVTEDVAYESSSISELGLLDVYAPEAAGEWPVLIMYHGGTWGVYKDYLAGYAKRVAQLGFVVFVPSWGHSGGDEYDALTVKEQIAADVTQAACAAAFAAEHAAEYGGDASSFTAFGHSFGGNAASMVTLAPSVLADGCLANEMPQVDTLVPWEGSWLLVDSFVDPWLVDDPSILEVITPWTHLPAPTDLEIVVLRTDNPGEGRRSADAAGPDGWLALRDPDGALTAALEATGAFTEDLIGPEALDTILIETLEAQGAEVTLHVMPDSNHNHLSAAGLEVFLDAFREIGGY